MIEWGVTDLGYEVLEKSGLARRIEEEWDSISDQLPFGAFVDEWEIKDLIKKDMPQERKMAIKKYLKENQEYDRKPADIFMISGKATDVILTKEERDDPKKFGVKNLSQLDGLIAAFCLTKHSSNPLAGESYYAWHSSGFRTQIHGDTNGDLQIHQVRTKPKGKNDFFGKLQDSYINAHYDYWPVLVATALKYTDTIGVKIPEAKNWQEFMKQKGWNGKIVNSRFSGSMGYGGFIFDYLGRIIAQLPDKTNAREVGKLFFGEMRPDSSHEVSYLPVIDLEQNLVFVSNSGVGQPIELAPYGYMIKFYPRVCVPKSDATHMFKGAVHGIMTHQSRTRPEFLAYMFWEYDQIGAGKSVEEIMKESHKFDKN